MPQVVGQYVVDKEGKEGCDRQSATYLANHLSQLVELDVQWGLYTCQFCSLASHMTNLCLVANG